MQSISKGFLKAITVQFQLQINSIHGLSHWKNVEAIGNYLSARTKADKAVVSHFAYLHDATRKNEDYDPNHGLRGKLLGLELARDGIIQLSQKQLDQLFTACEIHSNSQAKVKDITIATCLDADRIDLLRLGIMPEEELLYTPVGKELAVNPEMESLYKELTSSAS